MINHQSRAFILASAVSSADQLIKCCIRRFPLNSVLFSIPYLFDITHCTNTGAAFSILSGHTRFLAAASVIVFLLLLVYLLRELHLTSSAKYALGALCGGGLGNLADRLLFSGVTDYIRLRFIRFPVFNLADVCITFSVLILVFELMTGRLDRHHGE